MPLFFFDHRHGERLYPDDVGTKFETLEAARDAAKLALAEEAKDVLPGSEGRELAIEVSDENRKPLFRTALWFEVQALEQS